MAIALQSGAPYTNSGNGVTTLNVSTTVSASNSLLVVCAVGEVATNTISSITFDGVALTQLKHVRATTWGFSDIWYLVNPSVTTANVVVTYASSAKAVAGAYVFTGHDTANPIRSLIYSTSDSGTSVSNTLSNVLSTDYLLDSLDIDNTGHTNTAGANQTEQWDIEPAASATTGISSTQSGADGGVMSHSWTGANPLSHVAIGIQEPITARPDTILSLPEYREGLQLSTPTSAWGYSSYRELTAGFSTDIAIIGVAWQWTPGAVTSDTARSHIIEVATGAAGAESTALQLPHSAIIDTGVAFHMLDASNSRVWLPEPMTISANTRLSVRFADHSTSAETYTAIKLFYMEVAASGSVSVTPGVASLTTATFAPTVTASDHKSVTPSTASLTTSTFAPSIILGTILTPSTASLTLSTFAPTISVSDNKSVTPDTASLTTSTFAPTVSITDNKIVTPDTLSLTISTFVPTVTTTANKTVTPDTASLTLSTFAPSVSTSAGTTATPDTATLTTATFAPTVTATQNVLVTPDTAELTLTTFEPDVTATTGTTAVPDTASLTTTLFAPTVTASNHKTVTPELTELLITAFPPTVSIFDPSTFESKIMFNLTTGAVLYKVSDKFVIEL